MTASKDVLWWRGSLTGRTTDPAPVDRGHTNVHEAPDVARRELPTTRVALVQMPYGAIERPAIGLSILKSALDGSEFDSEVIYANIEFATLLGPDLYHAIAVSPNEELIGEWTFAGAAFPEFEPDHQQYLDSVAGIFNHHGFRVYRLHRESTDVKDAMLKVRAQACDFVDALARRVLAGEPRLVGCSSTFQQHTASLALLRRIKQLRPDVITLLGGGNCDGEMGLTTWRAFEWVDVVVAGEADELFLPLCRGLVQYGMDWDPNLVPMGVIGAFGVNQGKPRSALGRGSAVNRGTVENMDASPIPDYRGYYEAITATPYARHVQPGLLVETSRGCWWGQLRHCTFCGLNGHGMTYRAKSADRVIEEFQTLADRHGLQRIEMVDNILSVEYLSTVIPRLESDSRNFEVFCEIRGSLRRDQLERLAKAGIRWVQPGLESIDDRVLKLLDKGATGTVNIQMLKWARELGMRLVWLFLYDVPGEQDEWYQEMAQVVPLISHLQPPAGLTRIQYHRFSPYHERPQDYGIQITPTKAYGHVYPLRAEDLAKLAYFFDDYQNASRQRLVPDEMKTRPGLKALFCAVDRWRSPWVKPPRTEPFPALGLREDGHELIITDTRACAAEREMRARGLMRDVLLACEKQRSREGLLSAIRQMTGGAVNTWEELSMIVDELVERKILLSLGGRFLTLALREPVAPMPGITPCGHVDLLRYKREWRFLS